MYVRVSLPLRDRERERESGREGEGENNKEYTIFCLKLVQLSRIKWKVFPPKKFFFASARVSGLESRVSSLESRVRLFLSASKNGDD